MVEHLVAQVGLHLDGGAENAHAPQEAAEHHGHHDPHHGQADTVQQEVHVKGDGRAVHLHEALVYPVDDLLVQVWQDELDIVHQDQRGQPQQEPPGVFEVIPVNMFSKDHAVLPLSVYNGRSPVYHTPEDTSRVKFEFLPENPGRGTPLDAEALAALPLSEGGAPQYVFPEDTPRPPSSSCFSGKGVV